MTKLTVLTKRVGPIRGRHPWVFSGAIKNIPEGIKSGTPIKLYDEGDFFLAQGYFSSYSQIAVRLWSWNEKDEIDEAFFVEKIKAAYATRQELVEDKKTNSYRVVNSENDLLPGLIVDKYDNCLSVQFHNQGIAFWKKEIVSALTKVLKPKGIYERSDVGNREKEGGAGTGLLFGKVPEKVEILENGYKFYVDIINGQKTGFFLDQRDKRNALQKYCKGKKVLNCFSYTGGFSAYAMGAGAKKVVSVDSSQPALDMAKVNMKLNGFDLKKCDFICEDVKKYIQPEIDKTGKDTKFDFDVIVLDPPAFVKDRHKINEGLQGYRKINEAAIRALPVNGILVTASCSQHVSLSDFRYMLSEAAGRAGRTVQVLETYTHGIDHPELVAFTEGEYLKCVFAIVR
jgi:23S rRNA (cytosine1962-C5)-methyltransferase